MNNLITANNELNRWCNTKDINYYEGDNALGFLFKYAVPLVVSKLESKFDDALTNQIRGLERLFRKWISKIGEGYSPENALFWATWEVIENEKNIQ